MAVTLTARELVRLVARSLGGEDPVFERTHDESGEYSFHVEFHFPSDGGGGHLVHLNDHGDFSPDVVGAEFNACASVIRCLRTDHRLEVIDFSRLRLEDCWRQYSCCTAVVQQSTNMYRNMAMLARVKVSSTQKEVDAVYDRLVRVRPSVDPSVSMDVVSLCVRTLKNGCLEAQEGITECDYEVDSFGSPPTLETVKSSVGLSSLDTGDLRPLDAGLRNIFLNVMGQTEYHSYHVRERGVDGGYVAFVDFMAMAGDHSAPVVVRTMRGGLRTSAVSARQDAMYRAILSLQTTNGFVIDDFYARSVKRVCGSIVELSSNLGFLKDISFELEKVLTRFGKSVAETRLLHESSLAASEIGVPVLDVMVNIGAHVSRCVASLRDIRNSIEASFVNSLLPF